MGWGGYALLDGDTDEKLYSILANSTVAIDCYGFLHVAAAAYPVPVVCKNDWISIERTLTSRIKKMKSIGCTPIFCLDGMRNRMKSPTDTARGRQRAVYYEQAMRMYKNQLNLSDVSLDQKAAQKALLRKTAAKAVTITKALVHHVIDNVFRKEKVAYFHGPYEGEFQLAKCVLSGLTSKIICTDSDMLIHLRSLRMRNLIIIRKVTLHVYIFVSLRFVFHQACIVHVYLNVLIGDLGSRSV